MQYFAFIEQIFGSKVSISNFIIDINFINNYFTV